MTRRNSLILLPILATPILLLGAGDAAWASQVRKGSGQAAPAPKDAYAWLEDVLGEKPLLWVKARNAESQSELAANAEFEALRGRFKAVLDSKEKIPYVGKIGGSYYNFWRDEEHVRGLWRRTSLEEFRRAEPSWETVIDLDALSKSENENWVWHGASPLPNDWTRALVSLSRGGSDADVVREFDLTTMRWVDGGFSLPEAKSSSSWKDRDTIYVGIDFGPGSLTQSGYPRIVKEWKRGTPLEQAITVYEGKDSDVSVDGSRDFTAGFLRDFVSRRITFYSSELFLRDGENLRKIEKPDSAEAAVFRDWLLIELREEWSVGGRTWPQGALLAADFDDFMNGNRDLQMLFEPGERRSLAGWSLTKSGLVLNELDNVKSRLFVLRPPVEQPGGGGWSRAAVAGLPDFGSIGASAVDPYESDAFWITVADFLTPNSLHLAAGDGSAPELLKQTPAFFAADGLLVSQHEAISADGTKVPYFQVSRGDLPMDGSSPTLLGGYGGFEVSQLPYYSGLLGGGWLEKGGVYVLANIRGGGEFGPRWHQAALKANRPRAYEDFIAIGEDLVRSKVTSPEHLACLGGSNGGLLVGNMLTMRPDLFGAIVCQVPLLDMRRYHTLLAGASWMGEYGNPDDPEQWAFIQGFSPYHNLKKGTKYPRTLFMTSTRDDRVHPGHARKMVAKMKGMGLDVLYYENVEGGHAGAADNTQRAHMWALAYTFLWREIGP
jgi:prolyl oligopeptidase